MTLHYITLHCITLHYITYMHIYIYIYIHYVRPGIANSSCCQFFLQDGHCDMPHGLLQQHLHVPLEGRGWGSSVITRLTQWDAPSKGLHGHWRSLKYIGVPSSDIAWRSLAHRSGSLRKPHIFACARNGVYQQCIRACRFIAAGGLAKHAQVFGWPSSLSDSHWAKDSQVQSENEIWSNLWIVWPPILTYAHIYHSEQGEESFISPCGSLFVLRYLGVDCHLVSPVMCDQGGLYPEPFLHKRRKRQTMEVLKHEGRQILWYPVFSCNLNQDNDADVMTWGIHSWLQPAIGVCQLGLTAPHWDLRRSL